MKLSEKFEAVDTEVRAFRVRQQMKYVGYEDGLTFFENDQGQGRVLMPRAVEDFADPASGVCRVINNLRDVKVDLFEAGAIDAAKRDIERHAPKADLMQAGPA